MKNRLGFLLALILLTTALSACVNDVPLSEQPAEDTTATTTTTTETPSTTTTAVPTTTTVTDGSVIVADLPDEHGLNGVKLPHFGSSLISPALQEKMDLYSDLDVVYSVIVEVIWTDEEGEIIHRRLNENDELTRLKEDMDAAKELFEKLLQESMYIVNPPGVVVEHEFEKQHKIYQDLLLRYGKLRYSLLKEYSTPFIQQRVNKLAKWSDKELIPLTTDENFFIFSTIDSCYAFFMELTADEINDLAEQSGFVIRLVYPPGNNIEFVDD